MIHGIVAGLLASTGGVVGATDSALVKKSTGQTITTTPASLTWGAEEFDRTNWHDTVTNSNRMNVISGVTLARMVTNCHGALTMEQKKNGASFAGKGYSRTTNNGSGNPGTNAISAIIPVIGGTDYLETFVNTPSGNITPSNTTLWTSCFIEQIDPATSYCFCQLSANETTNNGTATIINWDTSAGTASGWYNGVNPSRITPNKTRIRVTGNIVENNVATNTVARIRKNGAAVRGSPSRHSNTGGSDLINFASAVLQLNGTTDYLEVEITTAGASAILADDGTWFQVEEIPASYKCALAYKTTNQNLLASAAGTVYLDATEYDDDGILQTISSTVTITIASPGVVSWPAHGLENDQPLKFTTTGSLPTEITAGTIYYVKNKTANDFQLAASPSGAAINTSGSQSGVHTATNKSRMLAPAGTTQARVSFSCSLSASTGGVDFSNTSSLGWVRKNNTNFFGMPLVVTIAAAGVRSLSGISGWVDIVALTDYFELIQINHSQARDVVADEYTWLCIEFR